MNRNPISQKALSLLLSFTLVLGIFGVDTAGAFAAQDSGFSAVLESNTTTLDLDNNSIYITDSGYYLGEFDANGGGGNFIPTAYGLYPKDSGGYLITQSNRNSIQKRIAVQSNSQDITQNITIKDLNIDGSSYEGFCAFAVEQGAKVNLTLSGQNTLISGGWNAGLQVSSNMQCAASPKPASLTITEQSDGSSLRTIGGYGGAGIGDLNADGSIIILGGTVTATGGDYGAGIGGGVGGNGGIVTVSGAKTQVTAKGQSGGKDIGSGGGGSDGGRLTVGDSNTAEPMPVLKLLSAGTNAANANNNRPQFMNCVIQGAGAKDASGNDISGCYDANGKVRLSVTMPTPVSGKVGEPVMLSANVKRHYFNDTVTLPGAVQFTTGSGKMLGSSQVTNGMAQTNWTPTNNNTVWLIATYVPTANDRYGSAESTPFDYTPGKTTPTVSVLPTASTVMTGSPLSVSRFSGGNVTGIGGATVPGSFEWANPNTTVTASGNYEAIFTPADTAVYNPVSGIKVPVTVTAAPAPAPSGSGGSSHSAPSLPSSLTDVPTNTTVNLSGAVMPAGVTSVSLTVTPEMANGAPSVPGNAGLPADPQGAAVYHLVISQTDLNLIGSPFVYNIQLLDQNGNPITSFSGTVTVKVAIPAGIHGTPHIFRYEESTGTFTDLGATVQDGYLVFTTTHFSYYVIAGTGDSITLDTKDYQMPVGGQYQIGVRLTGSKAATVKFHSTNDKTATATRLKNGNIQVTAKGTGTAYIMIDVYDSKNHLLTHASVKIDVKTGIRPRGDSTRQIGVF